MRKNKVRKRVPFGGRWVFFNLYPPEGTTFFIRKIPDGKWSIFAAINVLADLDGYEVRLKPIESTSTAIFGEGWSKP